MKAKVITFTAGIMMLAVPAVAQDCTSAVTLFNEAATSGDPAAIVAAHGAVLENETCADETRAATSKAAARAVGRIAFSRAGSSNLSAQSDLLSASYDIRPTWQVAAALGDLALDDSDYTLASTRFQESLGLIDNDAETPNPPPSEVIEDIFGKAEETGLLSETYVSTGRNRSTGAPEGLGDDHIRGFTPRRTSLPVTFEFDSTEFDNQGRAAAEDLLEFLQLQDAAVIRLTGHTDPRGSEDYNLSLSQRRADALAQFLRQGGYEGRVDTEGRGELDRFEADNPDRYTVEEQYRLDRRVVLERLAD